MSYKSAEVIAITRKGLDVMRKLRRLGQEKAAACNPQNPHQALAIP
jgi:hypothetical protein